MKKYTTNNQGMTNATHRMAEYYLASDVEKLLKTQKDALAKLRGSDGLEPLSFAEVFNKVAEGVHQTAREKGWYNTERNKGELLMLMVTEIAEACEALRRGDLPDDKIKEFSGVEAELADVIIRIMDFSAAYGYQVGEALGAKINFNKTRDHMHGGKRF